MSFKIERKLTVIIAVLRSIVNRVVPDLLFSNPTGAEFCRILMANPAGAGAGFFTIATI